MTSPPELERETKLRVEAARARRRLEGVGARLVTKRHLEENWVLDTPSGRLEGEGRLLRLRRAAGTWLLTLKGPSRREGGHKLREESETEVGDGEVLLALFAALGYEVAWRYEKRRSLYRLGEVKAALDETPIGDFLELEGPAGATEEAARRLGYDAGGFLDLSYHDLWKEAGGSGPLLFGKESP